MNDMALNYIIYLRRGLLLPLVKIWGPWYTSQQLVLSSEVTALPVVSRDYVASLYIRLPVGHSFIVEQRLGWFPLFYPDRCAKWEAAVRRSYWKPYKHTRICSVHFVNQHNMSAAFKKLYP